MIVSVFLLTVLYDTDALNVLGLPGYLYPADVRPHPPSSHPPVRLAGPAQSRGVAHSRVS